jgi:hypothetical protein
MSFNKGPPALNTRAATKAATARHMDERKPKTAPSKKEQQRKEPEGAAMHSEAPALTETSRLTPIVDPAQAEPRPSEAESHPQIPEAAG